MTTLRFVIFVLALLSIAVQAAQNSQTSQYGTPVCDAYSNCTPGDRP